jgi:O-antigen ligase
LLLRPRAGIALPADVFLAAVLLIGVLGWAIVQASPSVPEGWVHPLRAAVAGHLPGVLGTISLDPDRTVEATARLSAWIVIGVLAHLAARDRDRARWLLRIFLATATAQAIVGLLREGLRIDELFGVPLGLGRASGTFVNANHFAAYVNVALVAATVLLLDAIRARADAPSAVVALARTVRRLFEAHAPLTALWAILAMGSLASGSRGGFLSLVLAVAVVASARLGRGKLLAVLLATLAGLGTILLLTAGVPILERLDQLLPASELEPGAGGRIAIFAVALVGWLERPWLGHGLGAWPALFHHLRDERFPTVVFDYVHNTWLELLVELGAPAFVALLSALCLLTWTCLRAARRRDDPLPAIGLGVAVLVGAHSLVDFPAQIPAVTTCLAMVLGLAVGRAAYTRFSEKNSKLKI